MPTIESNGRRYWQSQPNEYRSHKAPNMAFYNSTAWRKLRALKIETDPLCELCLLDGVLSEGKYVDHTHRINKGGRLLPGLDELKTLCVTCDARKRQKESREVGGAISCDAQTSTTQPKSKRHAVNVLGKGG